MNHILSPHLLSDSLVRLYGNRETSPQQHDFRTIKLHDYQLVLTQGNMKNISALHDIVDCRSCNSFCGAMSWILRLSSRSNCAKWSGGCWPYWRYAEVRLRLLAEHGIKEFVFIDGLTKKYDQGTRYEKLYSVRSLCEEQPGLW